MNPATGHLVAIDIGGANLKYVDDRGHSLARPFPMWKQFNSLAEILTRDLAGFGAVDRLLVTMTGELADCFVDRHAGVRFIVDAVIQTRVKNLHFYDLDGAFVSAQTAKESPMMIAAANWHATASWVASTISRPCLLVDIGTTTTDLIPLEVGRIATSAKTDPQRLAEGSLVYVGARRTPVCALVDTLVGPEGETPVMNEFFATIDDARLLLGHEPPDAADYESADSGPRTIEASARRMLRMIGHDLTSANIHAAVSISRQVHQSVTDRIDQAIKRLGDFDQIVLVGQGDDLLPAARAMVTRPIGVSLRSGPCEAMLNLWSRQCAVS
jgi:(4-(4-[2-(gamma-L-glutamylamino)ethyl]phenoxymethyl)furan-2-yl)methanamine synthase